jgi:hypothetical protein
MLRTAGFENLFPKTQRFPDNPPGGRTLARTPDGQAPFFSLLAKSWLQSVPHRLLSHKPNQQIRMVAGSAEVADGKEILVAGACNHPNCLVLPFRLELVTRSARSRQAQGAQSRMSFSRLHYLTVQAAC